MAIAPPRDWNRSVAHTNVEQKVRQGGRQVAPVSLRAVRVLLARDFAGLRWARGAGRRDASLSGGAPFCGAGAPEALGGDVGAICFAGHCSQAEHQSNQRAHEPIVSRRAQGCTLTFPGHASATEVRTVGPPPRSESGSHRARNARCVRASPRDMHGTRASPTPPGWAARDTSGRVLG